MRGLITSFHVRDFGFLILKPMRTSSLGDCFRDFFQMVSGESISIFLPVAGSKSSLT